MANKEAYRTINRLRWWWFHFGGAALIMVTLHLSCALAHQIEAEAMQNATSIENKTTSEQPLAEALIRFRRQPPRTIVKHIIRPKRYKIKRVKRPKIKYSFAEPPSTYYTRKPIVIKKPAFDSSIFENFSHMNVESADFDLPPSSYETQSMDLDFYKHYEPSLPAASYKEIHKPSLYAYAEPEMGYKEPFYADEIKTTSYAQYSEPEITYKATSEPAVTYSYVRKPHTKYGLPTEFHYSSGYDKPSDIKYTLEGPASHTVYSDVEHSSYNTHAKDEYSYKDPSAKQVPRIPATTYGVPDVHIRATGSKDYNKYSVVEQKPSHANQAPAKTETYHFAEPPPAEPNVEITYSPSYEINIPSPHGNVYAGGKYKTKKAQSSPASYDDTGYQEHPKYEEPFQQYHPSTDDQAPGSRDIPSPENYEDTVPYQEQASDTNQPASYQHPPSRHRTVEEYIPRSEDLPINVNHKQPTYDYPKSSYEVPIYDAIPFDASNQHESEFYPPHIKEPQRSPSNAAEPNPSSPELTPHKVHSSGSRPQAAANMPEPPANHLQRTRKKKRTKGSTTTVSTTKHILDVPELEEAFEKENRKEHGSLQEPDANESQRFEKVRNQNKVSEQYSKGPWNPMKIRVRTSPTVLVTTASPITPMKTMPTKSKRYYYKRQRPAAVTASTTSTTEEAPLNIEIISIEKSKSKSYYDGVVSTPKIHNQNFVRNRFRFENTSAATTPQANMPHKQMNTADEHSFSKRTTKNTFDTTIFKSPFNDKDVHRNLPKNHKLF